MPVTLGKNPIKKYFFWIKRLCRKKTLFELAFGVVVLLCGQTETRVQALNHFAVWRWFGVGDWLLPSTWRGSSVWPTGVNKRGDDR